MRHERLAGEVSTYEECVVELGLEQISLVALPPLDSLHRLSEADRAVLKYLLWGDRWPSIARHEPEQPTAAFDAPDVLIQVIDATALERDLELTLALTLLGRPLVIALNRMDEARDKGLFINVRALSERLGVPVVPTVAHMGKGVAPTLRRRAGGGARRGVPAAATVSPHIAAALEKLKASPPSTGYARPSACRANCW